MNSKDSASWQEAGTPLLVGLENTGSSASHAPYIPL
jgi:hypothetical protein